MTDRVLHLAHGFSLPAEEFIESKFGIIGQSGRGKTGLVRRILEECHRVGLPFVVFDPSGILWGLRSSFDGTGPGIPVLVIGGEHGDLPLKRDAGAEVARAIIQSNVSCVIDLSQESKATYRTFAKEFAETLFAINDAPRLVVIDEAPELVPQSLTGRPDLAATFDAVERLVRQGRNKGIGVVLVSQRAAKISKDVLTQCGSLFIFGLVGTPDRKALREWVEAYGSEEKLREFEAGLAMLERRECWFWSPSEFKEFRKVRVLDFHTLHPDRTHLRKLGLLNTKPVTTDVSGIVARLGKQMEQIATEKAGAAEAPRLRAQVQQLREQLERSKAAPPPTDFRRQVQQAVADSRREIDALAKVVLLANRKIQKAREIGAELSQISLVEAPSKSTREKAVPPATGRGVASSPVLGSGSREAPFESASKWVDLHETSNPSMRGVADDGAAAPEANLRSGAVRMLGEIASRYPIKLTRSQLATLVGMAPTGGTYNTYLGELKRRGLLSEDRDGSLQATQEGLDFAGQVPPAPSTHAEVLDRWVRSLRKGNARMLTAIARLHPAGISKPDLAAELGMEVSGGTFNTYLGILRRNELVVVDGDQVTASDALWPEMAA